MPQSIYEVFWIFIIYAFIGWGVEVVYAGVNKGVFVNRGFLYGPYCPIYGCGVIVVVLLLYPIKENWIMLFLGSFLLTTFLEYITGFILEKLFHNKWWDYSNLPFNIHGYVCIKFSILWGLGCTFIIGMVHPMIYKIVMIIPETFSKLFIFVIIILFLIDVCVTVSTILHFNRRIKILDELTEKMKMLSDELGEAIFGTVTYAVKKTEKFQEEYNEKAMQLSALRDEYTAKLKERHRGIERLLKAFPDIQSRNQGEMLKKYKEYLKENYVKKFEKKDESK